MKKNKFTEIRNRTAYIHDLLVQLEEVIKEAEIGETINTTKRGVETFEKTPYLAGSIVNELADYEEVEERKTHCYVPLIGATILVSVIAFTAYLITVL